MANKYSYVYFMLKVSTNCIHYRRITCRWRGVRLGLRWGCWYVVRCYQYPDARLIIFTISNN